MHKSNTCEKQKRVSMTVTFRSHACARLVLRTVGKELSGDGASQAYGYKIQTADNPGTMYKQRWTICTPLRRKLSSNFETTYKQYVRNDLIRMKLRKAEIPPPPLFFFSSFIFSSSSSASLLLKYNLLFRRARDSITLSLRGIDLLDTDLVLLLFCYFDRRLILFAYGWATVSKRRYLLNYWFNCFADVEK